MSAPYPPSSVPVARAPQPTRARAALVAAALVVVIALVSTVFSYLLPSVVAALDLPGSSYGLLFLPFQIVEIVLAIVALVLGIPPLAGPGPRGIAGMAVSVAGAWLVVTAFSLAAGWILSAVM